LKTFLRMSLMREKSAIDQHLRDFNGIVIDAHILETYQNATSGYIVTNSIQYIIDPVTYKFALDLILECTEKKWYSRLIDIYGIEDFISANGILNLRCFNDQNVLNKFVQKVMNYQRERISSLSSEVSSWFLLLESATIPQIPSQYCLIPPYFIINSNEILNLNINLINSVEKYNNEKIYALIPIDYEVLFSFRFLNDIIDRYSSLDVDGYFIWITNFNEKNERSDSLELFIFTIEKLKSNIENKEIINMFGGYFSTILSTLGILDGLVHGIGISESRDPYSLGGPAPTRYYSPIIHRMLSTERAEDLLHNRVFRCQCPICDQKTPSNMVTEDLIKHVLNIKVQERIEIENHTLTEICEKLHRDYRLIMSGSRNNQERKQLRMYATPLLEWRKALDCKRV